VIGAVQRLLWLLLDFLRRSDRLWSLVEHSGIVIFVGPNGSGKSLAAVHSALRTLRGVGWTCDVLAHHHARPLAEHIDACSECDRDTQRPVHLCPAGVDLWNTPGMVCGERLVYSTVPLLDDAGEPHDLYRPLVDFRQLVTVEHSDVLFDEVAGVSDAADSSSIPVQVTNWLHQLRKRDVRLRVTTPAYGRCSKPIRQVAQVVVDARSFFPEASATGRLWRPRKGMLFRAFDAFAFDDFSAGVSKGDRIKPLAGAAFWRPGSEASRRYDTLSSASALGHVTEGGMCAVCGGSRSRPKCACGHDVDDVPVELLAVEEVVSASGARTRRARVLEPAPADPVTDVLERVQPPAPDDAPPATARPRPVRSPTGRRLTSA
jgi:hypothetical protein